MKPLFVILINYRRPDHLFKTVSSLLPSLPPGSKVVIYDNNSPEQEIHDYLYSIASDQVKVILADKNEGWGIAMNEGLRVHPEWKDYEYVLESNNDVLYGANWFAEAKAIMERHADIGLLGLWKHIHHGTLETRADVLIRDNSPAVSWLFRSKDLEKFLPFPEHGPTKITGGNGEDVGFTHKVIDAGFKIGAPKEDLSVHLDGYNEGKLGTENALYD